MNWAVKSALKNVLFPTAFAVATLTLLGSKHPDVILKNVFVYGGSIVALAMAVLLIYAYLKYFVPLRKEQGFPFVYVESDGTVRELDAEEQAYLNTKFSPGDGGRPYIKNQYDGTSYDGSISGFIYRDRVPKAISIRPESTSQFLIQSTAKSI